MVRLLVSRRRVAFPDWQSLLTDKVPPEMVVAPV